MFGSPIRTSTFVETFKVKAQSATRISHAQFRYSGIRSAQHIAKKLLLARSLRPSSESDGVLRRAEYLLNITFREAPKSAYWRLESYACVISRAAVSVLCAR